MRTVSDKTPEQQDADRKLEEGIAAVLTAYNQIPDDSIMVDFLIAIESADMNMENESHYSLQMRGGTMRGSVALGLCEIAKSIILEDLS